jgi:hypothetical protein
MSTGLDPETLDMALEAIRDFAEAELPPDKLLEFDAKDEVPLDVVRAMCGDKLGIQLLFIPEEYNGMGGGTFDVYRVCEAMARIEQDLRLYVGGILRRRMTTKAAQKEGGCPPMQCPLDRTTLVTLAHHGVPTEYCPQCRGMWLAAGTLQRIVERAVDEIETPTLRSRRDRPAPVAGLITTAGIRR